MTTEQITETAVDTTVADEFDMGDEVAARTEAAEAQVEADAAEAEAGVNPTTETAAPAKIDGVRDPKAFEKGTWQHSIVESARLTDRSTAAKKKAGVLLWSGATAAISEWEAKSDVDVHGEVLAADLLDLMGTARKGDVSKIKTVALAVKNAGLDLDAFENLSKAYAEAVRLTKTTKEEAVEDDAADKAVEAIAAPASTTTVEGAALLLLSKGIDPAIEAILDALNGPSGENNVAAHRSFLRAVAAEVNGRAKPVPAPATSTEDKGVAAQTKATPAKAATKATPAKAKPAATKATPVQTDKTKTALPPKATPVKATPAKAVPVKR